MAGPRNNGRLKLLHPHEIRFKIEAMFLKTKAFDKRDLA